MTKTAAPARLGVLRRHKILTAVGGTTALVVVLGIAGTLSGTDAAAVVAVVEKSQVTSASIDTASSDLSDALAEAKTLAEQTSEEIADPADHEGLLEAIEAAEVVAAEPAAQATTGMSLEEAEAAHAGALALLARLDTARGTLRTAMDAATQSHQTYLAEAAEQAAAEQAAAEKAAAEQAAAEKAAAEQAAAEKAAAEQAAAEKAAAEQAAADAKASSASAGSSEEEPSGGGSAYYKNCTAARDAGAAPVRLGDPGYGKHLDRDGDGIGCE